jgi:2-hydroxymuconate-semialdehyde hydrolase
MAVSQEEIYKLLHAYVLSDILGDQTVDLDESTPLLEWGLIDSLAMVNLLAFIEERLQIQVPDEQVKPEHFENLRALSALLIGLAERPAPPEDPGLHSAVRAGIRTLEASGVSSQRVSLPSVPSLHYLHTAGRQPPWVLLPALGNPASSWGAMLRSMADDQESFSLDLPGFGVSSAASPAPSFREQVSGVREFLETVVARPSVLIGSSAGAMIATEVARQRGDLVTALAIIGFGRIEDPHGWWRGLKEQSRHPARFHQATYYSPPNLSAALQNLLAETLAAPAYHGFLDEPALAAMPGAFEGLRCPVLFIAGEEDRIIPRQAVLDAAARVPRSHVEWLSRCGHFPQMERSQEVLSTLDLFLKQAARTQTPPPVAAVPPSEQAT